MARSPKCPQPHFLQTELLGRVILLNNFGSFIEGEKDRLRCVRALSRVLVHLNVRCGRCHRQRLRSGINTTWENVLIEKHKSGRCSFRSPDWFVLFDLQIFSGGVYPPSSTSRTISFSISNSFWYYLFVIPVLRLRPVTLPGMERKRSIGELPDTVISQMFVRYPFSYFWLETGSS